MLGATASRLALRVSLFAGLVLRTSAHTNAVCTSTSPTAAGSATFHLGTYHTTVSSAAGSVCITNPSGSEQCFTFGTCYTIPSTTQTSTTTLDAQILANSGIPTGSTVTCYQQSGGIAAPTTANMGIASATGSYATVVNLCQATVAGTSGNYRVRTSGTDANFNDCDAQYSATHPCALAAASSSAAPMSFPITFAGAGASCPSTLPSLDPNVDSSALAALTPTLPLASC
jgi:hypothetical protein